ncbi:PAS domain-containing protein [uncultured Roseobacter sp.]|uniref:PAS domain-containing protein n=1 Tax=uncultured Roseobacter sp. TaxID=114847 RepID=UPI0026081F91|nr:PAS domain-containing protein [uncultured Roseobacter sp.]
MLAVEDVIRDLADGRLELTSRLFNEASKSCPTIVWKPSEFDLIHPTIQAFSSLVRTIGVSSKAVQIKQFDALDLESFKPWMMRLRVVKSGKDFEYVQYGEFIAEAYGSDLTGHRTSCFTGYIQIFFRAVYSAVIKRNEWVLSCHEPPSEVFVHTWRRLVIPLEDDKGEIAELAVINVPDNEFRAGFEALSEPILVLNDLGTIVFANKSAQKLFGERRFSSETVSVSQYCGLDYELPKLEKDPGVQHKTYFQERVSNIKQLIVHFELTSNVAYYRGKFFFVVSIKPS